MECKKFKLSNNNPEVYLRFLLRFHNNHLLLPYQRSFHRLQMMKRVYSSCRNHPKHPKQNHQLSVRNWISTVISTWVAGISIWAMSPREQKLPR